MSVPLSELVAAMERIAPPAYAEAWDNVGLLAGDPGQAISKSMLAVDYTAAVAEEAVAAGCEAVVAYHPPIFKPISRLAAPSLVFDAIRRGIALYSPHTALDVAEGGTNDCLADAVGLHQRQPIEPALTGEQLKLVTFVPPDHVEQVRSALFAAGAGRIGNYSSCSFRSGGTGTFFGEAGAAPSVGRAGRLEEVAETRLETVVRRDRLAAVVAALRASHPYEEPAFDLIPLAAAPSGIGMGRIGLLDAPVDRAVIIEQIKQATGISHVLIVGPGSGRVQKVAVCAGSCGSLLDPVIRQGAELFVTGELRHHDALKAQSAGLTVICTLHSNSERLALSRLRQRLAADLAGVEFVLSQSDRDPFAVV